MRFAARHMDAAAIRGGFKRRADSHLAVLRGRLSWPGVEFIDENGGG
jgi:hypothetical protein